MMTVVDLTSQLDAEGRYLGGEGELEVVFATRGGERFPGRLGFRDGLCIRWEVEGGGRREGPEGGPLSGIRSLLDLGGPKLAGIAIDQGRVILLDEARDEARKWEFLRNFRIARNLSAHPRVVTNSSGRDTARIARDLSRSAIWLTPRSVANFNAADFSELGKTRQGELRDAVRDFRWLVQQLPPDRPATHGQLHDGDMAFSKLFGMLAPYLAISDEDWRVEWAIESVKFPEWVVNWVYQLESDSEDKPILRVDVFADERTAPMDRLGIMSLELADQVSQALDAAGVERWPYIRMKTARQHKTGAW